MGDLHSKIVSILAKLCRDITRESGKPWYKEVFADNVEGFEKKPLGITLVRRGRSLIQNFYPDIWAEYPRAGVDVFEVWHSESENEAINDIVLSSLVKNIKYLHIVCTGYRITKDKAGEFVDLILNKLHNRKGELLLSPDHVYIADIPKKIHKRPTEIEDELRDQLKL